MSVVIVILPVKEVTAATLWVEVPEQYTKTDLSQVTGEVYGCGSFSYSPFDIIDGNFFQKLKLITKCRGCELSSG
jgi:hypothetical protein